MPTNICMCVCMFGRSSGTADLLLFVMLYAENESSFFEQTLKIVQPPHLACLILIKLTKAQNSVLKGVIICIYIHTRTAHDTSSVILLKFSIVN